MSGARFRNSSLFFLREDKFFASTLGTVTEQRIYRAGPGLNVTAVTSDFSDFQSRQANEMAPIARGWEYVLEQDMVGNAPRWAEEAVERLSATGRDSRRSRTRPRTGAPPRAIARSTSSIPAGRLEPCRNVES